MKRFLLSALLAVSLLTLVWASVGWLRAHDTGDWWAVAYEAYPIFGFAIPYSWLAVFAATTTVPVAFLWAREARRLRVMRWRMHTRCPGCGFDMRGGGERCPECGIVPAERRP